MVVSADGLPLAVSERLERAKADQLAAIASGLASLSQGTARCFDVGLVKQTVVEMQRGLLFVTSISDGSCLTVLAASSCDLGVVAYEMAVLVTRAGDVLTPTLRAELQAALPARTPNVWLEAGQLSASQSSTLPGRETASMRAGHA